MIRKANAGPLSLPWLMAGIIGCGVLAGCVSTKPESADASAKAAIGAPCDSNDECESQLCEENICQGTADQADPGDAATSDGGEPTDAGPTDNGETTEVIEADALSDASGADASEADVMDVSLDGASEIAEWDSIKSDCEELGIADDWVGTFTGTVVHDLTIPENLGTPPEGDLPVAGELSFSIECVDSKFEVDGILDGFADYGDQKYPFTLTLKGYYNPATKTLAADIIDGKVLIMDLVEVYFAGVFDGQLATDDEGNDTFSGSWFAEATGTNAEELIQGTASASGAWEAIPASDDDGEVMP